jgi:catechol 2,3-dioxygenase
LDFAGIMAAADRSDETWNGIPAGTRIGHMHLQVSDVERSRAFYQQVVGLDVTNRLLPGAAFLSAGGYHHHLGLNSWNTAGKASPNEARSGLVDWRLTVGDDDATGALLSRAELAGVLRDTAGGSAVVDPDGIVLQIR